MKKLPHLDRWLPAAALLIAATILIVDTTRHPHFWRTADQQGDALLHAGRFADAAKTYTDPWHIGVAQYRNGDFEAAAHTFARVPGATGAFDAGNAWLMHGQYDTAIASYDRALGFRPGWPEALENKALAAARKAKIEASAEHRTDEAANAYKADEVVFDQKGENKKGEPVQLNESAEVSDAELRATWLRRVQTTPADFLRAKFSHQAARREEKK